MTQARARTRAGAALRLTLYVAGRGPNSEIARRNLRDALQTLDRSHELEVVDVLESPDRAAADEIFITPALVRHKPSPERRILGNLSDTDALLFALRKAGDQDDAD